MSYLLWYHLLPRRKTQEGGELGYKKFTVLYTLRFNLKLFKQWCEKVKEQDENHHRNAHANKEIYSGSVLPTPTSTTQPQLGFPLYPLGIQPVWFYKLTTPTCCFDGSQRTFTRVVLQDHHTNLLFYRLTTNLSGFTRLPLKLVVFKANNEPLSTLGWGPTFLKVEFELTNSRTKNNLKNGQI